MTLFKWPKSKIPIGIRMKRVLAMDRQDGRGSRLVKLPSGNGLLDEFYDRRRA